MEYTCFEGLALPLLMDERGTSTADHSTVGSTQLLLESFRSQQQPTPSYFCNPQYNFPGVSWSTTDPTLLLNEQQQYAEALFNRSSGIFKVPCDNNMNFGAEAGSSCGLSNFLTVVQHSNSGTTDHHHHDSGVSNGAAPDQFDLPMDAMGGGGSSSSGNTISSSSSTASYGIDPFSFCGAGDVANASHLQWMQMCSVLSDQYNSCGDAMMPKLVSDVHLADSQQQQQHCMYYASSTSVDCLQEADSCGSSDRDRSTTTSEEINWMNRSNNNSDHVQRQQQQQQQHGRGSGTFPIALEGGNSVTGLMMLPSVAATVELPDEYSSSMAAAADDVDLANVHASTTTLDVRHHHQSTGSTAVECSTPTGRVSWMSPSSGSVVVKNHVTTLDPLLLLRSPPAASASSSMQHHHLGRTTSSSNEGVLLPPPRPLGGAYKQQQQQQQRACYTLDSLPTRPQPMATSQTCSISPRFRSGYPMAPTINPGIGDRCNTTSASLYKDFHNFANRQQGVASLTSTKPGSSESKDTINVGGGFGSRREYFSDQSMLLSTRKHNATSIEPQSVAARHRRKKISERVSILEKLIPGGNKMDTASMLDEAIEYVKFLQLQVQLLESMGEVETFDHMHSTKPLLPTAGTQTSFSSTPTTMATTSTTSSAFHVPHNCNVDGGATIGRFGSSHLRSSSALMQQLMSSRPGAATAATSTTSTPLILSEVLQEQLFKQKLCLVSLRQYCPQQQGRRSC